MPEAEELHDASFIGFQMEHGILQLKFRHVSNKAVCLQVSKVFEATAFGIGMRNTVEGVYIENIDINNVEYIVSELKIAAGHRILLGDMKKICDAILEMGASLLVVEPSEGGGVLAICDANTITLEVINN